MYNPEADEVKDEDLQAAAAMHDRIFPPENKFHVLLLSVPGVFNPTKEVWVRAYEKGWTPFETGRALYSKAIGNKDVSYESVGAKVAELCRPDSKVYIESGFQCGGMAEIFPYRLALWLDSGDWHKWWMSIGCEFGGPKFWAERIEEHKRLCHGLEKLPLWADGIATILNEILAVGGHDPIVL